jgi:hypothetical protein
VRRLGAIITTDMLPADASGNIAGPSAVATGKDVRLYFADHKGTYIRLAFADNATEPWEGCSYVDSRGSRLCGTAGQWPRAHVRLPSQV